MDVQRTVTRRHSGSKERRCHWQLVSQGVAETKRTEDDPMKAIGPLRRNARSVDSLDSGECRSNHSGYILREINSHLDDHLGEMPRTDHRCVGVARVEDYKLTGTKHVPGIRRVLEKLNVSFRVEIAVGECAAVSGLPSEFLVARNEELNINVAPVSLHLCGIPGFSGPLHVRGVDQFALDWDSLINVWGAGLVFEKMEGLCESGVQAEVFFAGF